MREDFSPDRGPSKRKQADKLNQHLAKDRYDDFVLTNAIRPPFNSAFIPEQGYKVSSFPEQMEDGEMVEIPCLMISVTRDTILPLFRDLMTPLGSLLHVGISSIHPEKVPDLLREHIDAVVLDSVLCDDVHDDVIHNDGHMDITVLDENASKELLLSFGKIIIITSEKLGEFCDILSLYKIPHKPRMRCITEIRKCIYRSNSLYRDQLLHLANGHGKSWRQ
jgi:hypothetical protein